METNLGKRTQDAIRAENLKLREDANGRLESYRLESGRVDGTIRQLIAVEVFLVGLAAMLSVLLVRQDQQQRQRANFTLMTANQRTGALLQVSHLAASGGDPFSVAQKTASILAGVISIDYLAIVTLGSKRITIEGVCFPT